MNTATVATSDVTQTQVRDLLEQIWSAYLDPEGVLPLLDSDIESSGELITWVSMTGGWDGHLVIECSRAVATDVAATMLELKPSEVSKTDIADATGELANIIGGNIKALLPAYTDLSLPQVLVPTSGRVRFPATRSLCRIDATWDGGPVSVRLLHLCPD